MVPTTAWPDTEAVDPVWLGQARFRPGTLRPNCEPFHRPARLEQVRARATYLRLNSQIVTDTNRWRTDRLRRLNSALPGPKRFRRRTGEPDTAANRNANETW